MLKRILEEDESEMVEAHKDGIRMFAIFNGDTRRAGSYARFRYYGEHQREAFMAGFKGAKRRSNGSKI